VTLARQLEPGMVVLDPLHEEYRAARLSALTPEQFMFDVASKIAVLPQKGMSPVQHLPVCTIGRVGSYGFGWGKCAVMIVAPAVTTSDLVSQGCLQGYFGSWLTEQLLRAGVPIEATKVTHAMRFVLPEGMPSYRSSHKSTCAAYVQADCIACMPEVIITLGADALKSLFGKEAKLDTYRGSVHQWRGIPVVPTVSPLVFAKSMAGVEVFQSELARALKVMMKAWQQVPEMLPGYRVLSTAQQVEELEQELAAKRVTELTIDTEFGNDVAREEFNYLLSWQCCWAPGEAAHIDLRGEMGSVIHSPEDLARIRAAITRIANRDGVELSGQHLRVDVEMPLREGMDYQKKLATGFDTMLAHHLLYGGEGDEGQGLDHLTRKYAPEFGAYWYALERWLETASTPLADPRGPEMVETEVGVDENGETTYEMREVERVPVMIDTKGKHLEFGYRNIPLAIRIPYGLKDVDVNFRAMKQIKAELAEEPRIQKLFTDLVMPTSLHLMHVEREGLRIDLDRVRQMRAFYEPIYNELLVDFRKMISWPDFNPNSRDQKTAFLFSTTTFRGKKLAPKDAKVLSLTPLYNTDKYPMDWSAIQEQNKEELHAPSAKATTLDLLATANPGIRELRLLKHLSVLGKFLSTYLKAEGPNIWGVLTDGKNIANNVYADGRVRGHFYQTSSTGRYRCAKPNMQTNPKKQEEAALDAVVECTRNMTLKEYRRRTDDRKKADDWIPPDQRVKVFKFKSCYIPRPGHVFIEADFKTAEICILAYASGDPTLIEIIEEGRDLHSETAARAFQLPVLAKLADALTALKAGNKKLYKDWTGIIKEVHEAIRTATKSVVFGIFYGRGARALVAEIAKTGVRITVADCEMIIKGFADAYPVAWAWLNTNKQMAVEKEYVETAFGRRRYFTGVSKQGQREQAAAQREALNAPIQGCVADLLAAAGVMFDRFAETPDGQRLGYHTLLPIHDAFLFEVPIEHLKEMKALIKLIMSTLNRIPGTDKSLGVDIEVFRKRWGELDDDLPLAA
jgi:DNA polymerase I-like protein with 3'-5' exonuclease and polymerase domains